MAQSTNSHWPGREPGQWLVTRPDVFLHLLACAIPMLALTLHLKRRAENDGSAPLVAWTGRQAQAWFLSWLHTAHPEMAAALHDSGTRNPYTVSPLLIIGDGYTLRITALIDSLAEVLDTLTPSEVRIGVVLFDVIHVDRQRSSYALLVRTATEESYFPGLRFVTATTFHSNRLDVPLPLPSLVFGSLVHAWECFSPLSLPLSLGALIRDGVALSQCDVQTRHIPITGRGGHVGFTGRAFFSLRPELAALNADDTSSARALLGALLAFAEYAGLGVQTSAGMGQVRLLKREDRRTKEVQDNVYYGML